MIGPPGRKKGIPIEHTEQVEHHRWTPPEPHARGLAPLDGPTRALLRELRWRKAPPDRRRQWSVLLAVLALHALFAWLTWHEMQVKQQREALEAARRDALLVRLIPRPPRSPAALVETPPPAAPALPPPPPPHVAPPVHEPPAKQAMTVSLPPSAPAAAASTASPPSPRLYDASGMPLVPSASSAPSPQAPGYVSHGPPGDSKVMQHSSPITYQATRFDKDWSQGGGSSVDDALKRAVDKSTVKHTFHVAPGVRIHCAITLAALAGGCGGDPPPQPLSKNADMRLNMAPANLAAPAASAPKPPSEDECIAIYRADKPLPYGCPIDTPTRSVDAEMRERAAHHGDQDGG